ncbi:MAG: MarR family transcriptional regulator [Candidatus Lokiarchaeota archaeon]|nr:MarR family transcriptional regulator [Candidatus Lokiarchaeota archaeon]
MMDWKKSPFDGKMRKLYDLPPSGKFVLYILDKQGIADRKQLVNQTLLSSRTIGSALKVLLDLGYIKKEKPKKEHRGDSIDNRKVLYRLRRS